MLVVDDSALVRKLLGQVLGAEPDLQVEFARNGLEALEKLTTFKPDVLTLDIHMPELDGLQTLDRIMLERPSPVVMVSSLTEEGAEITLEALRLGAVDFVAKPGGAVSLRMDEFAPQVVAKVRSAVQTRLPSSLRLKDRIRHRTGSVAARRSAAQPSLAAATGEGLVLVGTSTGGPPALEKLLTGLPGDFPWPVLVAQHMPATFTGPLAKRLNGLCALEIVEVDRTMPIERGHVYIGRGDGDIVVAPRSGGLVAKPAEALEYPWHPSTDRLVRSAMACLPAGQLIGVLMTGMGDDGASAMTLLRDKGGRVIAEAEETAIVWGMPGELVKAGGADLVLPLPDIAARLRELTPCR